MRFQYFSVLWFVFSFSINKVYCQIVPKEYQFPEKEIGAGKKFKYSDDEKEISFTDFYFLEKDGRKYLVEKQYTHTYTIDSALYFDSKVIEKYSDFLREGKLTKAEIFDKPVNQNSTKSVTQVLKLNYDFSDMLISMEIDQEVLGDTLMSWGDKKFKTIIVKTVGKNIATSKLNKNIGKTFFSEYQIYYAKGIGIIKIRTLISGKWTTRDLIEIANLEK